MHDALSIARGLVGQRRVTERDAYAAGYDAGRFGASDENAHFRFFATADLSRQWSEGCAHGKADASRLDRSITP